MTKSKTCRWLASLLLVGLTAACETGSAPDPATASADPTVRLFVGTATGDENEGIYTFRFDTATGALAPEGRTPGVLNPSYLAPSPAGPYLYAVNETGSFEGAATGSVSAFRVDSATGALTLLNRQPSLGTGPCYVAVDASGRWVLVANYGGGSVALYPAGPDGRLGAPADSAQHTGASVNPRRQTAPHAHFIDLDPQGRYALAADLGIDQVRLYGLDRDRGRLLPADPPAVAVEPGSGPRHLAFHPDGRFVYLINELAGSVTAYAYASGRMEAFQTVSTLPDGFEGTNSSADIHVHPSGRFLYASNRGDFESIAVFTVDPATGRLALAGHQREGVHRPRNFALDPSGRFLLVANRSANTLSVFRIDPETGLLRPTGHAADVPEPTCVKFSL